MRERLISGLALADSPLVQFGVAATTFGALGLVVWLSGVAATGGSGGSHASSDDQVAAGPTVQARAPIHEVTATRAPTTLALPPRAEPTIQAFQPPAPSSTSAPEAVPESPPVVVPTAPSTPAPTATDVGSGRPAESPSSEIADFTGAWELKDTVTSGAGAGETYTFRIQLSQVGSVLTGGGGGLVVNGVVERDTARVEFVQPAQGYSGTFTWTLVSDGLATGSFVSSAPNRGVSVLVDDD